MRSFLRYHGFGLTTLLGLQRLGVFIPYRYVGRLAPPDVLPEVESFFQAAEPTFAAVLDAVDGVAKDLLAIANANGKSRSASDRKPPRFSQTWFPRLDAAVAYALVRARAPKRILEIGAGHSTRFLARAVRDAKIDTEIKSIDPDPRAKLDGLAVHHIAADVQDVGTDVFAALAPGDVLFIDSSHLLLPGSDVDILFSRILPHLPAEVLIHIHDIFLPDSYPRDWAWRGYNEQQALTPLLMMERFKPVFASHYVGTRMMDRLAKSVVASLPLPKGARESSLWLETRR